jgi:hypothetical protein
LVTFTAGICLACGGIVDLDGVDGAGAPEGTAGAQAAPEAGSSAINLRYTLWKCGKDRLEFQDYGKCRDPGYDWGCTWTQEGNQVVVDWTPPEASAYKPQRWAMTLVEPWKMGGTKTYGGKTDDLRCDRKE